MTPDAPVRPSSRSPASSARARRGLRRAGLLGATLAALALAGCTQHADNAGASSPQAVSDGPKGVHGTPRSRPQPDAAPRHAPSGDGAPGDKDAGEAPPSRDEMRVRFGIRPGDYEDVDKGVLVGGVTPGTSAEAAGIREGDRLMTWNGAEIVDVGGWMRLMSRHKPGDVVEVGVLRNKEIIPVKVTLRGRDD